jgi:hypothetical protein
LSTNNNCHISPNEVPQIDVGVNRSVIAKSDQLKIVWRIKKERVILANIITWNKIFGIPYGKIMKI